MQSGIVASAELHDAFKTFTSDTSLFALPITITSESLQPQPAIPLKSDFKSSLPSLSSYLQPKTPIYLILRQPSTSSSTTTSNLVIVTYVPSIAPVRSKTLFASTRSTLVRDLGLEKSSEALFVTDAEEILDPKQWDERAAAADYSKNGPDTALLTAKERELQSVRRAEEEERHGTSGRDLMGEGGSGGKATSTGGGLRMKVTDEARAALSKLKTAAESSADGLLVQLGIAVTNETLTLSLDTNGVAPEDVSKNTPSDKPSYTFYQYPGTGSVLFIYTCPGSSKVKERMVYAASRNGVIEVAKSEGVVITKRLEGGDPDDISAERLKDEAGVRDAAGDSQNSGARQGFARPKRPGKR